MDQEQQLQEEINSFLADIIDNKTKYQTDLSGFLDKVSECEKRAATLVRDNESAASCYYFFGSLLCLDYSDHNGKQAYILQRGNVLINKAISILPDDPEYRTLHLIYRILGVDTSEPRQAFLQLKGIHEECPSFKLFENNILPAETWEDNYNDYFETVLSGVIDGLFANHETDLLEEACDLLKTFPATESKLKAYTMLSRVYRDSGKQEEALRTAKLGVELLGSQVQYDYKNPAHQLWADCWTLVAQINRSKKESDFAMSLFEKGEQLEIVPCIRELAEMYKNGEGDEADPAEADRLTKLADSIEARREKERLDEEERIRKEEEARQAEIRKQEEAIRIAEEMKARKKEILARRILLAFGCVCCVAAIIWGLLFLKTDTILDHVVQYDNAGKAIISLYDDDAVHSVIYMDKQGVFVDDMQDVKKILPLGVEVETKELGYTLDERGLSVTKTLSETPLIIKTSRDLSIKRMSSNAFLLSTNHASFSSGEISNVYHITTYDTDNPSVIWIDKGELSIGYIYLNFDGDVYPTYRSYFRKAFSQKENTEIVKRKYGIFSTQVLLSLPDGVTKMATDTRFPVLSLSCPSIQVGKQSFRDQMEKKIKSIFREEFVESLYNKAIKLTGVKNKSLMRLSPDDRYTFVIAHGYQSGENSVGLLKVDNSNNTVSVMDAGMEVAFQESRIYVKRYATFLLFFDSHKDVFYDYYGNMR